ncbi:PASTA domain-containing protein [Deinococcus aetherius]|uniref:PASTA domain-containing protein n=1 Tax=Deinococcus aetherius TaxID=200252 RepID=A0ABM8AFB3_9DEIO|nr:PASTA domain-containing protein [Deinococcus aetherius]BDP42412.1 PASTA domain-containing protein [Deinococcus aetherius]
MTAQAGVIDGKYEVVRELGREGNVTLSEVRSGEGVTRRLAWFEVSTPEGRQGFHAYRSALRAIEPAGLTDVVARPGAYYAVWQPVAGMPLSEFATQPKKQEETLDAVRALAARLAEHGYALPDADVVIDGREPRVAYLRPAPGGRSPEEVVRLSEAALAALNGGKIRRKRERQPDAWLAFVPGLLLLGGAVYLGAQAAQIYLNPPVREVVAVAGKGAQAAAESLTGAGFRVEYTLGDANNVPIGAVIRQDPAAGTQLPVGRLVTLTVNNPPSLSVPRLEELTVAQARAALRDSSLTLGQVYRVDGTLTNTPEGRIVAQVPESGANLQRGQPVQILVSTGVRGQDTWIADLTGLPYQAAREHARAAGLVVNRVVERASDAPENTVLEQKPAPYVRVPVGSPVTLTVAVARYSTPSRPAGSLPLPPQPPTPETPDTPEAVPGEPTTPPAGTDAGQANAEPLAPENIPATPLPTPEGNATGGEERTVNFRYVFPSDLPAGTYTIAVRDSNGEREILAATDGGQLAGATAEQRDIQVTGDAVFVIRQNGAEYTTVTP